MKVGQSTINRPFWTMDGKDINRPQFERNLALIFKLMVFARASTRQQWSFQSVSWGAHCWYWLGHYWGTTGREPLSVIHIHCVISHDPSQFSVSIMPYLIDKTRFQFCHTTLNTYRVLRIERNYPIISDYAFADTWNNCRRNSWKGGIALPYRIVVLVIKLH